MKVEDQRIFIPRQPAATRQILSTCEARKAEVISSPCRIVTDEAAWESRMQRLVGTLPLELQDLDKFQSSFFPCYFWKVLSDLNLSSMFQMWFNSLCARAAFLHFTIFYTSNLGFVQYWMRRGSIINNLPDGALSGFHLLQSKSCTTCHWMPPNAIAYTFFSTWLVCMTAHHTDAISSRMSGSQKRYQQLGTRFCLGKYGNLTPAPLLTWTAREQ